jgi:hypothetical protein
MRTEYTKELINTKPKYFSQTKKEWEDEIYQYLIDNTERSWSRGGITMMFGQLIVNTPHRIKLGSLRDMFVELEDGNIRPYYPEEDKDLPHYYYDRSKTNINRDKQQKMSLDEFVKDYIGPDINQFLVKDTPYNVLIVTQCSKKKTIKIGSKRAGEFYHGNQVQALDKTHADYYILSAKHGWVHRDEILEYYTHTFNSLSNEDLITFGKQADLRGVLDKIIEENKYDLVIYCLGETYLKTLQLDKEFNNSKHLFVIKKSLSKKSRPKGNVYFCETTSDMTLLHGDSNINLKGRIIADLDKYLDGDWKQIVENPNLAQNFANKRKI